jgi:cytochrome P450
MNAKARELAESFDLEKLTPDFYADPYPTYSALREHEPVKRMPNGSWFLTRYDDLVTAYKNTKLFCSDKRKEFAPKYGSSPLYEHHTTSLVFNDPPAHTRVRRLIMGALSPRAIAEMEPDLVALVDRLCEALAAKGNAELIGDFASAIPVEVIGNLLDVPHEEREPLRDWSLAILGALEPVISPEVFACGNHAVKDFLGYLEVLVERRRAKPGNPDRDVLTRLIQGEDGERLTEKELLHNCIFLLNAGHETTTNLIGNALVALSENPNQKRRLIEHPEMIKRAVEEILRFESSNQLGNRMTTDQIELGGTTLAADTPVTLCIGAANRDPRHFADPETLDVGRTPNRHLAFGTGAHQCAGMALARLEGAIAISRFLARFPNYALNGAPLRGGRVRFRGFLSVLPCLVRWAKAHHSARAVRSTSNVGTPQLPLRNVSTRVPGLRPVRTSDTSTPAVASRARVASMSATRQLRPQSRSCLGSASLPGRCTISTMMSPQRKNISRPHSGCERSSAMSSPSRAP